MENKDELKKYNIVSCDIPWFYNDRLNGTVKGASSHYPVMKTKDICDFPVNNLTTDNALLFMWVTAPCIPDGLEVIKAWGFKYITVAFTWMKLNKSGWGLFYGIGAYTSANAEFCFVARKGKRIRPRKKLISSAVLTPIEEHSKKPDEVIKRIDLMYPDNEFSKLEMFARRKFNDSWDVFGNEVEETISLYPYYDEALLAKYKDKSNELVKPKHQKTTNLYDIFSDLNINRDDMEIDESIII